MAKRKDLITLDASSGETKPVLQPVGLTNETSVSTYSNYEADNLRPGQCIVCRIDADGNEIEKSEFTTTIRMWNNEYSKRTGFKLKKK